MAEGNLPIDCFPLSWIVAHNAVVVFLLIVLWNRGHPAMPSWNKYVRAVRFRYSLILTNMPAAHDLRVLLPASLIDPRAVWGKRQDSLSDVNAGEVKSRHLQKEILMLADRRLPREAVCK